MKSTLLALSIALTSIQSMAMTVAEYVESQPAYKELIAQQSVAHACGGFGEIGFDDRSTLMSQLSSPGTPSAEKLALNLAITNWPSEYQTLYSGRAECSDSLNQRGVEATVGQKDDGSFSLIKVEKYDRR
ncbi:MAG: hypothetical protein IPJ84_10100 [Bdellovibrionales bacterium]|nr:hypothetical protein [Bdellovibrionales bacterium]